MECYVSLPFTTRDHHEELKTRMKSTGISKRVLQLDGVKLEDQPLTSRKICKKFDDNFYAFKMKDFTWGNNSVEAIKTIPNKESVKTLLINYRKNIDMIEGYQGIEKAERLFAINDLLLNELISQLRIINLNLANLVDQSRKTFAKIYFIFSKTLKSKLNEISNVEKEMIKIKTETDRIQNESLCRVKKIEKEFQNQIDEINGIFENENFNYRLSFQKLVYEREQHEAHNSLFKLAFTDFHCDPILLRFEEEKYQIVQLQSKINNKKNKVKFLEESIEKWKAQHQNLFEENKILQKENESMKKKLGLVNNKDEY
jgi:hypothetical protein